MSDGSSPDYEDSPPAVGGQYDRNYTLAYNAASAGQTLTVSWVTTASDGNVTLNGAALSYAGGSIAASGGTPQSATVNTAFARALQVAVRDAGNNPLIGVPVTFTASGTGASAAFSGSPTITVYTNTVGTATAPAPTANGQAGSYTVTATVAAAAAPANFSLTNAALMTSGGSLSGSGSNAAATANLTAEGTADWVHWGGTSIIRKAGVTPQIGNYAVVGSGNVVSYSNYPRALSWTDGTPTGAGTDNNGIDIYFVGNGFSFTAPADTSTRTLSVYAGGYFTGGTLTAHLSDGSAADFVDTTALANSQYDRSYTLTYNAASAGQTLTVSWVASSGTSNVTLSAAALWTAGSSPGRSADCFRDRLRPAGASTADAAAGKRVAERG